MSMIRQPDTILAHPALTGRTLLVRAADSWAAFEISSEGRLGDVRPAESDPVVHAWRGGAWR